MASYNKVILMGNLTRDPVLRTLPQSETQVCDFALAVNRRWKDAGGADREEVLFIDCAAFGKTAQAIGQNLAKGRPLHIEGRLKLEQWEQEGQRRSKIRVIVEQFRFVDRKPSEAAPADKSGQPGKRKGARKARPAQAQPNLAKPPQPESAQPQPEFAEPVGAGAKEEIPF